MTNCWLHGACVVGLAALAFTARVTGIRLSQTMATLIASSESIIWYTHRKSSTIVSNCTGSGVRGRSNACPTRTSKSAQPKHCCKNPQVREQIYAKCFSEWGEKGDEVG